LSPVPEGADEEVAETPDVLTLPGLPAGFARSWLAASVNAAELARSKTTFEIAVTALAPAMPFSKSGSRSIQAHA
jgi:hypothetical protein